MTCETCETCEYTMLRVDGDGYPPVFWCPQCGSLKTVGRQPNFVAPKRVAAKTALADMIEGFESP